MAMIFTDLEDEYPQYASLSGAPLFGHNNVSATMFSGDKPQSFSDMYQMSYPSLGGGRAPALLGLRRQNIFSRANPGMEQRTGLQYEARGSYSPAMHLSTPSPRNPEFQNIVGQMRSLGMNTANAPVGRRPEDAFDRNFDDQFRQANWNRRMAEARAEDQGRSPSGEQGSQESTSPRGGGLAEQFGRDLQGIPVVGPLAYGVGKTVLQPLAPVFGGLSGAFDDIGEGFRRFGTGLGGLFQ